MNGFLNQAVSNCSSCNFLKGTESEYNWTRPINNTQNTIFVNPQGLGETLRGVYKNQQGLGAIFSQSTLRGNRGGVY